MGRPKRVIFEKFGEYDKLHTEKTKMMSGVEQTTLYPIKETTEFYTSIEVWAYCASKFRAKKKNVTLSVDIPIIEDEKTIEFLERKCWNDWVKKQTEKGKSDIIEAVALLNKIFPDKEMVYFYELDSIIGDYLQGVYASENMDEHDFETYKYRLLKYAKHISSNSEEVLKYRTKWTEYDGDDKVREKLLDEYLEFEMKWLGENVDMKNEFSQIGKNSVCYPVAFSSGTGMWAIETYGKPTAYSNAGEIFFVVTNDKVFFEVKRHF